MRMTIITDDSMSTKKRHNDYICPDKIKNADPNFCNYNKILRNFKERRKTNEALIRSYGKHVDESINIFDEYLKISAVLLKLT